MASANKRGKAKGHAGFIERHGLWSKDQAKAAQDVLRRVADEKLNTVRLSFADQHGILRGKSVPAEALGGPLKTGVGFSSSLLAKDTAHRTVFPIFTPDKGLAIPELTGAGDFIMVPNPATFRILPWAPGTGWLLCDLYFTDGRPIPFCSRRILRNKARDAENQGYSMIIGLEVEFHLLKLEDPHLTAQDSTQPATAPDVSLLAHGYNYLTEIRLDHLEPALEILRRELMELGLPLRSMEVEFGPSQCEVTFAPASATEAADMMVLFRSAAKQIARRNGLHITFMCRPGLPNLFASGWHLNQSLVDAKSGDNLFIPKSGDAPLSETGYHYMGGLLDHARAGSLFTTPTINGYKRFQANSLAPDRAIWARDNRGVMIRVKGGAGDPASRIENRVGEPTANPYLYIAAQLVAGLDGMKRNLDPGPPTETPYEFEAPPLPRSLMEAAEALRESRFYRDSFGTGFIDYLLTIKDAEIARFLATVTDWEQREYFEIF